MTVQADAAGGVVRAGARTAFGLIGRQVDRLLPFQLTVGCTREQAGKTFPVVLTGLADGTAVARGSMTVLCGALPPPRVVLPPRLAPPPPPPNPPTPAPIPAIQTAAQSQGSAQLTPQATPQAQTGLAAQQDQRQQVAIAGSGSPGDARRAGVRAHTQRTLTGPADGGRGPAHRMRRAVRPPHPPPHQPRIHPELQMNFDTIRERVLQWRRARSVKRRPNGRGTTVALLASLAVLLAVFSTCLSYLSPDASGRELTLDRLGALARSRQVATATFRDQDSRVVGRLKPTGSYWVTYPANGSVTQRLVEQLDGSGARVEVDSQSAKRKVQTVTTFLLPLMILANLFALLFAASTRRELGHRRRDDVRFDRPEAPAARRGGAGDVRRRRGR